MASDAKRMPCPKRIANVSRVPILRPTPCAYTPSYARNTERAEGEARAGAVIIFEPSDLARRRRVNSLAVYSGASRVTATRIILEVYYQGIRARETLRCRVSGSEYPVALSSARSKIGIDTSQSPIKTDDGTATGEHDDSDTISFEQLRKREANLKKRQLSFAPSRVICELKRFRGCDDADYHLPAETRTIEIPVLKNSACENPACVRDTSMEKRGGERRGIRKQGRLSGCEEVDVERQRGYRIANERPLSFCRGR